MSPARRATRRHVLTWTAAVGVPVLAGAAILVPIAASGAVDLPDKTPAELIAFAARARWMRSAARSSRGPISACPTSARSPAQWATSRRPRGADRRRHRRPDRAGRRVAPRRSTSTASARLQVLDQLGERDVYVDGEANEVWYVDSETRRATQLDSAVGCRDRPAALGCARPSGLHTHSRRDARPGAR